MAARYPTANSGCLSLGGRLWRGIVQEDELPCLSRTAGEISDLLYDLRSPMNQISDRSFCILYLFPPELHISLSDFSAGGPPSRCLSRDQIEKSRALQRKNWGRRWAAAHARRLCKCRARCPWRDAAVGAARYLYGISTASLRYLSLILESGYMRIGYKSPPLPLWVKG